MWRERSTARGEVGACYNTCNQVGLPWLGPQLLAANAIFTTWATVIDAQRPTALARALGATPRQVSAGLTTAQLVAALVAACIGIPAGLGLYQIAGGRWPKRTLLSYCWPPCCPAS
jgi:hypothetical protein